MRIPHHPLDARHGRQFVRRALRIAPGNQNLRIGVVPMDAADGSASVLVGGGSYRASVENDDLGFAGRAGAQQAALEQLPLDGRAVGLRSAASEVLDVVGCHVLIIPGAMMRLSFTPRA